MDESAKNTQRLVIVGAVVLALLIVFSVGYALWQKARTAEGELALKEELESQTSRKTNDTNISLTDETELSGFNYQDLIARDITPAIATETFSIVNETEPIVVPEEPKPKPIVKKPVYINTDRPLTDEEIRRIRMLPIDQSPAGNLQNKLETDSEGEYRARY